MPYIDHNRRGELDGNRDIVRTPGELNYVLTRHCLTYIGHHGHTYSIYNCVIGVLTCMIQEIYRRRIAPYEDRKKKENGDVF